MIISWPSPQTPNTEENTITWRHLHDLDQDGGVEADDFHLYHHLCRQSRPCHGAWSGIYHKDNAMIIAATIHCYWSWIIPDDNLSLYAKSSGRLHAQVWLCLGEEVCRWHLWWVVTGQPSYNMIIMIKTIIHDDYDVFCFLAYQEVCSGFTTITGFYR